MQNKILFIAIAVLLIIGGGYYASKQAPSVFDGLAGKRRMKVMQPKERGNILRFALWNNLRPGDG